MTSNPFFFLSIIMSSFLAFFTIAFLVEISIKIFHIRQHRTRSLLKLLPFLSLVVDLFFNQYSIAYWINPLSCASCLQKLFLEVFSPQLKAHLLQNQISLMKYLGIAHQHVFFSGIFTFFSAFSLFFVLKKIVHSFSLVYSLHSIAKRASVNHIPILNLSLRQSLQQSKVTIYLSHEIQIPLTVYPNLIIIPTQSVEMLSQEELEAVVAHEWEHVKYKDPISRIVSHLIAAFFWWTPTYPWIKKIEQEQELACDQNALNYGISADSIASALLKVTKQAKMHHQTLCYFTTPKNPTLRRIQTILDPNVNNQNSLLGLNFLGVFLGGFLLLMCFIYL